MAKYTSKPFGNKSVSDRRSPNKTQIAAAYDILSEGEIEGLVNGLASVFINDVAVIDTLAHEIVKNRNVTLDTTANTATVSMPNDSVEYFEKSGADLIWASATTVRAAKVGFTG